ncbi:rho GTPase activator [Histoplasma capsulatum var. duboisii H88]|uniref:Rho GTPase activator n=3 Tax=Ajellomyces capsulatus TaxID=5037 RepID=F0UC58_AJEC8|nr:rho GTPase activator [Histoplasma capsulatum var. duboisii H88]
MANSQGLQQDGTSSSSTLPAVLIYSRLPFSCCPPSYGFPQGKAERFFFSDSRFSTIHTKPTGNSDIPLTTMPNKKGSQAPPLHLGSPSFDELSQNVRSPLSPQSPISPRSPTSPYLQASTLRPVTGKNPPIPPPMKASATEENNEMPQTPGITAIPQYPPSPKEATKHGRDPSRSFFSNLKASKSSHRLQSSDGPEKQTADSNPPLSRGSSNDRAANMSSRGRNSSSTDFPTSSGRAERTNGNRNDDQYLRKESITDPHNLTSKKIKPRFANILTRTRSIRLDDSYATGKSHPPSRRPSNGLLRLEEISRSNDNTQPPLKTAPLQPDKMFRDVMGSSVRNRSADRPAADDYHVKSQRHLGHGGSLTSSSSLSQVSGASLFDNLKQTSSGAADRLGKAGKGFFGKITRSGSSNEREYPIDDTYTCRVINLPLVEQTRRTRISKRLEASKDKTEYWMPALPWRCIDYLNFKGCEEEGLYRVPGSGKDVKHWQKRFDTEYDINLFDEPDLYDINTIGSMFKAWLRELPDEIFPKATQAMIAEKCMGATTAPQMLKDELSKLPPFNYYLLFAITCHLSLLHSYVDKNKMDYRNLCICFQPCMKIDGFCFQFLVCDWKNCWQGCWTEKEYLAIELEAEKKGMNKDQMASNERETAVEERAVSSSGSSQAPNTTNSNHNDNHNHNKTNNNNNANASSNSGTQTSGRPASPKRGRKPAPQSINSSHSRSQSQLPELGPPLSPIRI